MFGQKPDYSALRVFGTACYPTLRPYRANKFDPKSLKCVFLGYNDKYKGYRCVYPPTGRVYISRHVLFDEHVYPFAEEYSGFHTTAVTTLLSAWQQSFLTPSSSSTEFLVDTSDIVVTRAPLQQVQLPTDIAQPQ